MENITEKQKAFADYYVATLNASESYKRAYPSCKSDAGARASSSKLLTNPNLQEYIASIMTEREDDRIAGANEVLEFLSSSMRSDNVSDKDRIKCAELLGKRYRLFIDKVESDVTQTVIFEGEDGLED